MKVQVENYSIVYGWCVGTKAYVIDKKTSIAQQRMHTSQTVKMWRTREQTMKLHMRLTYTQKKICKLQS